MCTITDACILTEDPHTLSFSSLGPRRISTPVANRLNGNDLLCSLGQHHSIWSLGRWHNIHKSEPVSMINRNCPVFCVVRIPLLSTLFHLCCVPHTYFLHTEFTLTSMACTPIKCLGKFPESVFVPQCIFSL